MNTTVLAFNPWRSRALGVGYVRLDINQRCVNSEASFFKWQQIQKLFLSGFLSPLLISSYALTIPACYSFGLIFGRSGSGKTTLLQLIAGLTKPTSGSIYIQRYSDDDSPTQPPVLLSPERVGIVFQFPERYFVADNVFDEITFGLPRQKSNLKAKEHIARRIERAIASVGLNGISLDKNPNSLSGGFKRRLALAIQLVQRPEVLVLDEPLAGLDWKARADVVKLLKNLKKELTILAVSHDLKELTPLVDKSWRMDAGGLLIERPLPI